MEAITSLALVKPGAVFQILSMADPGLIVTGISTAAVTVGSFFYFATEMLSNLRNNNSSKNLNLACNYQIDNNFQELALSQTSLSTIGMITESIEPFSKDSVIVSENNSKYVVEIEKNISAFESSGSPGGSNPGSNIEIGNEAIGKKDSETDTLKKPKVKVNWKMPFSIFGMFGLFGFFIPTVPFSPISAFLMGSLKFISKYTRYSCENVQLYFMPIFRTIFIFDLINYSLVNAKSIFYRINSYDIHPYIIILSVVVLVYSLSTLFAVDYENRGNCYSSHFLVLFYVALYYTYFSKIQTDNIVANCTIFLCFFASISQLHILLNSDKGSGIRNFIKKVNPFSE